MAIKKTSLTVPFGVQEGRADRILIEVDTRLPYAGWQIMLRVYANDDFPLYRATEGEIGYVESKQKAVAGEALVFSGTDSASLSYPPSRAYGVRLRTTTRAFDEFGLPTTVSVVWDDENQVVKASKKFYGIVEVDYVAPYRVVGYRFAQEIVVVGQVGASPITNVKYTSGWVYAYVTRENETPRFAAFEIPDIETTYDFGGAVDRIELYRQVSFAILTEDGMYEKSTTGDGTDFLPPNYSGYTVENKRTHLVGYMDRFGRKHELSYDIPPAIPYESQRLEGAAAGYPATSWEFTEFSDPSQTYGDSSLLSDAISHVNLKKKEVGE